MYAGGPRMIGSSTVKLLQNLLRMQRSNGNGPSAVWEAVHERAKQDPAWSAHSNFQTRAIATLASTTVDQILRAEANLARNFTVADPSLK